MKNFCCLLLFSILFLSFSACGDGISAENTSSSPQPLENEIIQMKVGNIQEDMVWLTCEDSGRSGLYSFSYTTDIVEGNIQLLPGMLIDVGYNGEIRETYPCSIDPVSITIIAQEEDFISPYLEALDKLYSEDPGLNSDTRYFGFDFTQVSNLSEEEKSMLGWLFASRYRQEPLFGTLEDLDEQGYLTSDGTHWEDGLHWTISDEPYEEGSFSFSIKKWRSILGSYGHPDCTANKGALGWTLDFGSVTGVS